MRDLVLEGHVKMAEKLQAIHAKPEDGENTSVDPYLSLLQEMTKNTSCNGAISRNARDMFQSAKKHIKYFESVRKSAAGHLRFLEGQGITNTLRKNDLYPRTFSVNDIKTKKISIFLCLPEDCYDPLDRWLRAMIEVLLGAMQQKQGLPENGHRVIFSIDEFANLGRTHGDCLQKVRLEIIFFMIP